MSSILEKPVADQTANLAKELETFERHRGDLMKDAGKYALVHGEELAGVFESYGDAIRAGYEKFGLSPFLVKQILQQERILCFTKELGSNAPLHR